MVLFLRRCALLPYTRLLRRSTDSPSLYASSFAYSTINPTTMKSNIAPFQERKMIDRFKLRPIAGDGGSECSSFHCRRHPRRRKAREMPGLSIQWTYQMDDILLRVLRKEMRSERDVNHVLQDSSYHLAIHYLNLIFDVELGRGQVRARYHYHRDYVLLIDEILKKEGFEWNVSSLSLEASEADWQREIAKKPEFAKLRNMSFPFYDIAGEVVYYECSHLVNVGRYV